VLEEHRTAVRNVRRDGNDALKKLAKEKKISEDDEKRALEEVQKMTDGEILRMEELSAEEGSGSDAGLMLGRLIRPAVTVRCNHERQVGFSSRRTHSEATLETATTTAEPIYFAAWRLR
jgi:hypothetical protein